MAALKNKHGRDLGKSRSAYRHNKISSGTWRKGLRKLNRNAAFHKTSLYKWQTLSFFSTLKVTSNFTSFNSSSHACPDWNIRPTQMLRYSEGTSSPVEIFSHDQGSYEPSKTIYSYKQEDVTIPGDDRVKLDPHYKKF